MAKDRFKPTSGVGVLPNIRLRTGEREPLLEGMLREIGRKCFTDPDKIGAMVDAAAARENVDEAAKRIGVSPINVRSKWQLAGLVLGRMRGDRESALVLLARREHAVKCNQRKPFPVSDRERTWMEQRLFGVSSLLLPDIRRRILEADLDGMAKSEAHVFAGVSIEPINKFRRVLNGLRDRVLLERAVGREVIPLTGERAMALERECLAKCQLHEPIRISKADRNSIVEKLFRKGGLYLKVDKKRLAKIVDCVVSGGNFDKAAKATGVSKGTIYDYRKKVVAALEEKPERSKKPDNDLSYSAIVGRAIMSVMGPDPEKPRLRFGYRNY
jgi:hypothetical protein